jgi:phosphoribosylaminoimidazole-succinocarboxamide synthase
MAGLEAATIPPVDLPHVASGKVREIYELDEDRLVFVTTDRISAYDVVMNETIPNKGRVLSAMTAFWFDQLVDIVPNHRDPDGLADLPASFDHPYFAGRTEVVHKADMVNLECITRGSLTGSAWAEYKKTGTIHGMWAPKDMLESETFYEPVFTPSTKATEGHDVNISFEQAAELVGASMAIDLRDMSLAIFDRLLERAQAKGIIVADTKIEVGIVDGKLTLCDEIGTSDSSRFWPADQVRLGETPPSYDKQYLRDYLTSTGWDKKPPAPTLPLSVIENTARKYQEAYEKITGLNLSDWPGVHVLVSKALEASG